jgi:beta-1,4-mannosyltransferase
MGLPLKVFMLPTFEHFNSYCSALIRGVQREGIDIRAIAEWTSVLPLLRMIRAAGLPKIVHLHWIETYTIKDTWWRSCIAAAIFLCELLLLRMLGVKIVWTIHDSINVDGKFTKLDIATRRLTAILANSTIVHTETARREVVSLYKLAARDEKKITVVPHGHFIEEYPNSVSRLVARETLGLDDDVFVFGFVGYLRPYKGVLDLIKAFHELDGDHLRLLIAGMPFDASFADAVKETARDDPRIQLYLEFIPGEGLQNFLNAMDVVVFPYSRSLTSGSLILAMSFGRAVVAADHATIREVLAAEGGVLYATDDFDALVRALREIQTKNVVSMGAENRKRAEAFGWQCVAKETVGIYRQVMGQTAA